MALGDVIILANVSFEASLFLLNLNFQAARVKDVHPDWNDEDIFQVQDFLPNLINSLSHRLPPSIY